MSAHKHFKRILSTLLTATMLLPVLPLGAAAENTTVKGEEVVTQLDNSGVVRENNFNKGWKFYLGTSSTAQNKDFNDASWKNVNLPHDFSISQSFTTSGEAESGFLPGGTGWYRKRFTLPAEESGKTFLLNFDGVYMEAYVYVNGTMVGEHHYGYTSFAMDISDYLTCDGVTENVIAVKTVNSVPSSRWYSGSGIYRDVTLYVLNPVHVDLNGTYVTTPNISSNNGTVRVEADIVNDGDDSVSVTVTNTVYKKGSTSALASDSATVTVLSGSTATAVSSPVVSNPSLWSVDAPNLYKVVTEVSVNGEVVDSCETEFGFRWFDFSSTGFSLNGTNVKLNGVCLHHDQGALGSAAYYDAMYRQLTIMKDMGVNAVRTSHNPADQDFIAICNELGLLVIEETFDGLNEAKNSNTNDFSRYFTASVDTRLYGASSGMTCAEYAARSMVKRDRNAPSIFAWSFGNEIQEGTNWNNVNQFAGFCENYISWVNDEDGSRIVTSGDNNRGGSSSLVNVLNKIINAGGVVGFNYANDLSTISSLLRYYGGNHNCIILSETSSHTNSRGIYSKQTSNEAADGKYHVTSFDTSAVTWGITAHESIYNTYQYDGVAGEFIWTGFDYIGEPTPWNKTESGSLTGYAYPNSSYFGAVDTAGFPKDTFYLYRAQWNKNATTVHLVTAWDSDNYMVSGGKVPVWLYSNAAKVELYLNGSKIGTATRTANTSAAGHTYYTYKATSDNSSVCSVSNGSGSSALYGVFNVAYTSGTLSTRAYDENGNEITLNDSCGRYTVTTPDAASKLVVSQNKTTAKADGSSLVYISVDVTDANGNLDTTATNNIRFSLTGNGKIVGVDNGDQATTSKYQQSSVLTGTTSANINAYAGKALVIVRTTEEAGSFTVNVSASGLTGGSAYVTTTAVSDTSSEGLTSYAMVKDYTVKAGTEPELDTTVTGTLADGTTVTGTIVWEPVSQETYTTPGDYTLNGKLTFPGYDSMDVTARLHVLANVIAMRNISAVTTAGTVPTLPSVVSGVLADGTLNGEFPVAWESVSQDDLSTVGDVLTVCGTATVMGQQTLPVTCTIRVAQAVQTESTNIAGQCLSLTQDIAAGYQSDNLNSINNGTTKPGDNTSERWTNWGNRRNSADATITMTWATSHAVSCVNIYYYYDSCSAYPEEIQFSYSLNGNDYTQIEATAEEIETYNLGAMYTYTFAKPIDPVGLKIRFTQKNGTTGSNCVGITELEVMTYASQLEISTSADLAEITVDGKALADFQADKLTYEAEGSTVQASTNNNAGITILPVDGNGIVRILTISEDASASRVYEVTVGTTPVCQHTNTEVRDDKAPTCTDDGYTGDTYCADCGELLSTGTVSKATGHAWSAWSGTEATCTEAGEKSRSCSACGEVEHKTASAKGHKWDNGVVTQEPTAEESGVMTYTCSACGKTRTEEIPYVKELKVPSVSVSIVKNASAGTIVITGKVDDFENLEDYYEITSHGLLYIYTSRLGARPLDVNSTGRTRISFGKYKEDGSYVYNMKPTSKYLGYTFRAYISYIDPETGYTVYVYSDPIVATYYGLRSN